MANDNKTPAGIDFGNMSPEQMKAEMLRLQKENEGLKAAKPASGGGGGQLSVLVKDIEPKKDQSGKLVEGKFQGGVVSIYGTGRFPVSLYGNHVPRVLDPAFVIKVLETTLANVGRLRLDGGKTSAKEVQDQVAALLKVYRTAFPKA